MRGVSLDDIAAATKIGTRSLRALEDEQFDLLPGGIFNKGFVRAYAKYLGLNADQTVADYLNAAGESSPDPHLIAEQNSYRIDRSSDTGGQRPSGFPIVPVVILLLFIAAGAGGWQIYQQRVRARETRENAEATSRTAATQSTDSATLTAANNSTVNSSQTQTPAPKPDTTAPTTGSQPAATAVNRTPADLDAAVKSQVANTNTVTSPTTTTQPTSPDLTNNIPA